MIQLRMKNEKCKIQKNSQAFLAPQMRNLCRFTFNKNSSSAGAAFAFPEYVAPKKLWLL